MPAAARGESATADFRFRLTRRFFSEKWGDASCLPACLGLKRKLEAYATKPAIPNLMTQGVELRYKLLRESTKSKRGKRNTKKATAKIN